MKTIFDTYVLPLGAVPTGVPVCDTAGMRGARPRAAQGEGTAVSRTLAPVTTAHGTGVSGAVQLPSAHLHGTGVSLGATPTSLSSLLLDDVRDDVQGLPARGAPV